MGQGTAPSLASCPSSLSPLSRRPQPPSPPHPALSSPGIIFVSTHVKLEGRCKFEGPLLEALEDGPGVLGHVELRGSRKEELDNSLGRAGEGKDPELGYRCILKHVLCARAFGVQAGIPHLVLLPELMELVVVNGKLDKVQVIALDAEV